MLEFFHRIQSKTEFKTWYTPFWCQAPLEPEFANNDVHVWRLNLNEVELDRNCLKNYLSDDEKMKAHSYRFDKDRDKYIIRRGILRKILSLYLSLEPTQINFNYSLQGKPTLSNDFGNLKLHFNVSNSEDLILYAVTQDRKLGIDIERIHPKFMDEQFISYAFSARELSFLQILPPFLKQRAFFMGWTRKEAFVKAIGKGLNIDPKRIELARDLYEKKVILNKSKDVNISPSWSFKDLNINSGYAGSIVVEGDGWNLKYFEWGDGSCF